MPSIVIGARDEEAEEEEELNQGGDDGDDREDEGDMPPEKPVPPPGQLRVLFCDVEGVLGARPDPRQLSVQGAACLLLRRLLDLTGAKLVLTTTWRRHKAYVLEVLANFGVFGDSMEGKEDVDATPFNMDPARRDLEVLQWLNSRRGEVASWAVLDTRDLLTHASAPRLQAHVIQVDGEKGLQPEHLEAAIEMLGGPRQGLPLSSSPAPPPPPAPPAPEHRPALDHLSMDEGLVSKMQSALAMLSTLGDQADQDFRPPQRTKELRCSPDTEFDAVAMQAKHKFT
mmetsp:Transcript_31886/g.71612  ORF Transcript_31886/g.71612 Transcript_31886/m.71612 type:complete len:284 (+) Transcript_31886:40-891(+)